MLKTWLNKETKSIKGGAIILAFSSLASRILGILRDRILASFFGASDMLDIYYASFQIPDFFYNIFILGTLSVAFIPIFTTYIYNSNGKTSEFYDESLEFTNTILNMVIICMGAGCLTLLFFTPILVKFVAPGFSGEKYNITITITRIMLISPFIFSLSSILSSILTSYKRFLAISFAPIFYNLGIIFGAIVLTPLFGIKGLSIGVIIGAVLHVLVQIPPIKKLGYKYKININLKNIKVKEFGRLFFPRIIGIDISQASLLIGSIIGSYLTKGSIAIFNLANNLQSLPTGIFGISLVSSVFPHLSGAFARNDLEQFREDFYKTISQILFFLIPSSIFLFILRKNIIELILKAGKFESKDVLLTSAVLGYFCLSLIPQGVTPLFLRSFYSMHDTITPVVINVICICIDIAASLWFTMLLGNSNLFHNISMQIYGFSSNEDIRVLGLAMGFSISSWITLIILYIFLRMRIKNLYAKRIFISFIKFLISSVLAGTAIYFILYNINKFWQTQTLWVLIITTGLSGIIGILVYLFACWILGSNVSNLLTTEARRLERKDY
ncbi:MAG: murein biosynthesis integral membrane protein MurJ [Candidatus Firestonebacteria bacterium]|nr:murein biosynthesis integral membrane protein MurJ [Candidatus Firestonebacteria bacterium]